MNKLINRTLLLILCISSINNVWADNSNKKNKNELCVDGPYLFKEKYGKIRSISVNNQLQIIDTVFQTNNYAYTFPIYSPNGKYLFDVKLREQIERDAYKLKTSKKTFITSDPHGDWDSFSDLLLKNNIINAKYEWSYGKNQLVVIGDVFDRGYGVLPIFWLLYKLESEALTHGGRVIFLLGNHEPMVLGGDLRYVKKSYLEMASQLNVPYEALFAQNSVLGEWLGVKNTMQILGKNLIVHAGVSRDLLERCYTIPMVNAKVSEGLFIKNSIRKKQSIHYDFLYGNKGPIWYRGMVSDNEKYYPIKEKDVQLILKHYKVNRIIVGHTIFPEIKSFFDKGVIAVNLKNEENRVEKRSRAILIEKDKVWVVSDKEKVLLK